MGPNIEYSSPPGVLFNLFRFISLTLVVLKTSLVSAYAFRPQSVLEVLSARLSFL